MKKYSKRYKNELANFLFALSVLPALLYYFKNFNLYRSLAIYGLCMIASIFIIKLIQRRNNLKLLNSGIDIVDKMTGEQFEEFLLQHFRNLGYSGYVTRGSHDYGADLVVKKDGISTVVQAKRWKQKVGVEAVQQIVAAIKHYGVQQGIVVTNSFFTNNALNLAKSNNIMLWNRNKLISILMEKIENISDSDNGKAKYNVCPMCGKELIHKHGKRGSFIGCTSFPHCKYTRNI